MSEIKHVTLMNELPVETRFTVDAFPGKVFKVEKADIKPGDSIDCQCNDCCFLDITEIDGGLSFIDCDVCFCCRDVDRKDKTAVIFKEVKE